METPRLTDGTIVLCAWSLDDAALVHEMVQDPEIPRFMGIPVNHTLEGVERWLGGRADGWAGGQDLAFAVRHAEDDRLLGSVGIERSNDDPAVAEVGYWLAAGERRKGFAKCAVSLIAGWAFTEPGVQRLEITTHTDNEPSQRVAYACGFTREGVLRAYREHHDTRVDLVMFSRLPHDAERGDIGL